MSVRNFGSLAMVATCAGAALGCYLVSLRVASERAQLEDVETRIVLAQRDLRVVQTEIGTRARLSQLERWNAKVLALSAPAADQFLTGSFELARLAQPQHKVEFNAPVVLASAPAPEAKKPPIGEPEADDASAPAPVDLLRQASLKTGTREVPATTVAIPLRAVEKSTDKPVAAATSAPKSSAGKPGLAAAKPVPKKADQKLVLAVPISKKSVDKPAVAAAKPMTKPVRIAKADVLAPTQGKTVKKPAKDHVSGQ